LTVCECVIDRGDIEQPLMDAAPSSLDDRSFGRRAREGRALIHASFSDEPEQLDEPTGLLKQLGVFVDGRAEPGFGHIRDEIVERLSLAE
jgi:hypothetical protein